MSQPEFIDNLDGNTLEVALKGRLEHLLATLRDPVRLSVATGYFNPGGFGRLAGVLRQAGGIRLLLGAEPLPPATLPERRLGEPRGERFEARLIRQVLEQGEERLRRDRDRIPFDRSSHQAILDLLEFLESGKIEVRRYEDRFLHGKAYLFSDGNGVIAGSSNFTTAGLTTNLELNLGQYQPSVVGQVEAWFEKLWDQGSPFDLASIYEARFGEYHPYLIYLRVLWERYRQELAEEEEATGRIQLTRFQSDGVFRAKRILDRFNGVLVADSVGLGKSFIAGDLFTEVIEKNRQRALLVAPAQLRDGSWDRFKARYQVGVEVVSYEQLANDVQLGGDGHSLRAGLDEYSLIVIDEAHAFRNPDTKRARALRHLLRGDPPKKVVMLTATPVNNSLWDLYDLLAYFVGHDAAFADAGIPSLKKRFQEAAGEDPFSLKPDVLFEILDATTVRRTRHFVQRYYPRDHFRLPDGTEVRIKFPEPHVSSKAYDLDDILPGFFEEFAEILAPEEGEPLLTLARYWPSRYRRDGGIEAREAALVGLLRSGLLKRFESSAQAFANTTSRMVRAHEFFLQALEEGIVPSPEAFVQIHETDSDEEWEELLDGGESTEELELDVDRLKADVQNDLTLLEGLRDRAASVTPLDDPKLRLLREQLVAVAEYSEKHATGEQSQRNLRKVLIFSYFADTVDWIAEYLEEILATDRRLAQYRGRLAVVSGTDSHRGVSRREAVFGFVPESSEAPPGLDEDRFDILVTTDVLAEGMNLQQCGRIINYDLPWNPMRLVQRHGRIDRIGSPHQKVIITCVFPDKQLESLLALELRIRRKLAQAAASIGLDQVVIPGIEKTEQVFSETRSEIEALRRGEAGIFQMGGEGVHAHSGEEYRQELRHGLQRWQNEIKDLPWGVGSGIVSGERAGHFFCARVFDRVFLRFVPSDLAEEVERDSLTCLGIIACEEGTQRVLPSEAAEAAFDAWERARRDIFEEWERGTDPANLHPDVRPLFRAAAEHVRQYPAEGMTLEELDRLAEALEAPWGIRIEKVLRKAFKPEEARGGASTKSIANVVKELGLQPWRAPEPLPPIEVDEVDLVVWMAVQAKENP